MIFQELPQDYVFELAVAEGLDIVDDSVRPAFFDLRDRLFKAEGGRVGVGVIYLLLFNG